MIIFIVIYWGYMQRNLRTAIILWRPSGGPEVQPAGLTKRLEDLGSRQIIWPPLQFQSGKI
jgi:hypothetical protein